MDESDNSDRAPRDSEFIFDEDPDGVCRLNVSGKIILYGLISGLEPDEITAMLMRRFDVSEEKAGRDVEQFKLQLKKTGIFLDGGRDTGKGGGAGKS